MPNNDNNRPRYIDTFNSLGRNTNADTVKNGMYNMQPP